MDLDQIEKKYIWMGVGVFTLLLILIIGNCHGKFKENAVKPEVASARISLSEPAVVALGKLEGPYTFGQCVTPSRVQLVNAKTKGNEEFRLLGLSEIPYVEPTPTPAPGASRNLGQPAPPPAEDQDVKASRLTAIRNFKMEGLKGLFDTRQLWLVRVSDQAPPMIYLFQSDRQMAPDKPATGGATLINAQALRRGVANMDLALPGIMNQALADMMLDCQLASYLEAQNNKATDNLWTKFKMPLPGDPEVTTRLEEVRKKM